MSEVYLLVELHKEGCSIDGFTPTSYGQINEKHICIFLFAFFGFIVMPAQSIFFRYYVNFPCNFLYCTDFPLLTSILSTFHNTGCWTKKVCKNTWDNLGITLTMRYPKCVQRYSCLLTKSSRIWLWVKKNSRRFCL